MMTDHLSDIKRAFKAAVLSLYDYHIEMGTVVLSETKKEFQGHYTFVVFPLVKAVRKKPEIVADEIGKYLVESFGEMFTSYNVIKGFLNLELQDGFWKSYLFGILGKPVSSLLVKRKEKVLVEFSSPNTNKPLHLGHVRNILLGWSTYRILQETGNEVTRVQIVNDRGIAICKSMLAWELYGEGITPESAGMKGDFLVGEYYRIFEQQFKKEYEEWQNTPEGQGVCRAQKKNDQDPASFFKEFKNTYFNEYSALGLQAKELLINWEKGDPGTLALWKKLNGWVYDGFESTYKDLGVEFDKLYFESETYLLGKELVKKGLDRGIFYQEEDGSIWVDLEDRGLDKKILLRSDGTSVYITQDLGTAQLRYDEYSAKRMIYVVADEQDYHFQVLFEVLSKLELPYADGLYHLSYGMVDLPSGRMKSREGTVVDADELIAEVIGEVEKSANERGELVDLSEEERYLIYRQIGLAALKFFILKVNPKKRMIFNPKESVDIQGQTGPYIQNAYVRIRSVERKNASDVDVSFRNYSGLNDNEIELIQSLIAYPADVEKSSEHLDPSIIANFSYDLARKFHKFYHDVRILNAESEEARSFRLQLCRQVAKTLEHSMMLLGIEMPERM